MGVYLRGFKHGFFSTFFALLPPVSVVSPLQVDQFTWKLRDHPNRQFVAFVLDGIRNGFYLGFRQSQNLKSATKNGSSAYEHPAIIDEYLANELSLGTVAAPFSTLLFPQLHVSSFGVIPTRVNQGSGA